MAHIWSLPTSAAENNILPFAWSSAFKIISCIFYLGTWTLVCSGTLDCFETAVSTGGNYTTNLNSFRWNFCTCWDSFWIVYPVTLVSVWDHCLTPSCNQDPTFWPNTFSLEYYVPRSMVDSANILKESWGIPISLKHATAHFGPATDLWAWKFWVEPFCNETL